MYGTKNCSMGLLPNKESTVKKSPTIMILHRKLGIILITQKLIWRGYYTRNYQTGESTPPLTLDDWISESMYGCMIVSDLIPEIHLHHDMILVLITIIYIYIIYCPDKVLVKTIRLPLNLMKVSRLSQNNLLMGNL